MIFINSGSQMATMLMFIMINVQYTAAVPPWIGNRKWEWKAVEAGGRGGKPGAQDHDHDDDHIDDHGHDVAFVQKIFESLHGGNLTLSNLVALRCIPIILVWEVDKWEKS